MSESQTTGGRDSKTRKLYPNLADMSSDEDLSSPDPSPTRRPAPPVPKPRQTISSSQNPDIGNQKKNRDISPNRTKGVDSDSDSDAKQRESDEECNSDEKQKKSRLKPVKQERDTDEGMRRSSSSSKQPSRKTTPSPKQAMGDAHESFSDDDTHQRQDPKHPTTYKRNTKSNESVQRKENKARHNDDKHRMGVMMVVSSPHTTQSEDDTNHSKSSSCDSDDSYDGSHQNSSLETRRKSDTRQRGDPKKRCDISNNDSDSNRSGSRRQAGSPETNHKHDGDRRGNRNTNESRGASDGTESESASLERQASLAEKNKKSRRGKKGKAGGHDGSDGSDSESSSRRRETRSPKTFSEGDGTRKGHKNRTGRDDFSKGNDSDRSSRRRQGSLSERNENESEERKGKSKPGRQGTDDDDDSDSSNRSKKNSKSRTHYEDDETRREHKNKKSRDGYNKGNDSDSSSRRRQGSLPERKENEREERKGKSKPGRQGTDDDDDSDISNRSKKNSKSRTHNTYDREQHDSEGDNDSDRTRQKKKSSVSKTHYDKERIRKGSKKTSAGYDEPSEDSESSSHHGKSRGNKPIKQNKGDTARKGDRPKSGRLDDTKNGPDSDDASESERSGRRSPRKDGNRQRDAKSRGDGRISSSHPQKENRSQEKDYLDNFSPRRVKKVTRDQEDVSEKPKKNYPVTRRPSGSAENTRRTGMPDMNDVPGRRPIQNRNSEYFEEGEYHNENMHHSTAGAPPRRRDRGNEHSAARRNSIEFDPSGRDYHGNQRNLPYDQGGIPDVHQKRDFSRPTGRGYALDDRPGNSWNFEHTEGSNYKQHRNGSAGFHGNTQGGNSSGQHKSTTFDHKGRPPSADLLRPSVLDPHRMSQQGGRYPPAGFSHDPSTSARLTDSRLLHILLKYPKFEATLLELQKVGLSPAAVGDVVSYSKTQMFELDDKIVRLRPKVGLCDTYESREGCPDKSSCTGLHICSKYVFSNCNYNSCIYGHNFDTKHNKNILSPFEIPQDRLREILKLSIAVPKASGKLQLCMKYNSSGCFKRDCDDLHICKTYLMNKLQCPKGRICQFNHQFDSKLSARVLENHGIDTNESPMDILKTLEEEHPTLFNQQQQKQQQPTNYQMPTDFQGRGNRIGTGLSSGPRMSTTQGAMAGRGSGRPFHGDDGQNEAFYGATGQTSNTFWSFHTEGNSAKDEICFHSVNGRCRDEERGCQRLHSNEHYHWQVNDKRRGWLNLRQNQVDELERAFCDPNIDFVKVSQPDANKCPSEILSLFRQGTWNADFQSMQLQNRSIRVALPLRRLCSENVNGKVLASVHQWYFLDQNRVWVQYGNVDTTKRDFLVSSITSDDIERQFLTNPARPLVFQNNLFKYVLDFNSMTQTNTKTSVSREVKRRPVPHMGRAPSTGIFGGLWPFGKS